jgi:hypothetical protein
VSASPAELPLNGTFLLSFDGAVDPISVTSDAVSVTDPDGAPLAADVVVEHGALAVRLAVTPALLARPPAGISVRLPGAPALRSLRMIDGTALGQPVRAAAVLRGRLEDGSGEVPRLVLLQGRPVATAAEFGPDGRVLLGFDGVLDPASVTPANCALNALQGGLVLPTPLQPAVDWSCVGRRFTLELRVPPAAGPLQFALRRSGLRDLSGRCPEPPIVAELHPAG